MKNSLKKSTDFKRVYEKKETYATKNMVLFLLKEKDMERNRYGISVSHKIGNSVVRHALTRKMREIIRQNEKKIKKGLDLIIVFRNGSNKKDYKSLQEDFLLLCKKHGILEKED